MRNRLLVCIALIVGLACHLTVASAAPGTTGVAWRTNLDAAKIEAAQTGRLLLIHFTTRTCGPCRMLDQQVFNQPQVAAAVERDFVPVRIDADSSPALAASFRIERVPTELIVTPEGQHLASPPIPDQPGDYIAQLQSFAQHFRQSQSRPSGSGPLTVNSAYASLPVSPAPQPGVLGQPAAQGGNTVAGLQQPTAQAQMNPYMNEAGGAGRYGQAQPMYPAAPQGAQTAAQSPAASAAQVAQQPATPTNAMPRSYRNPSLDAGPAAAGATVAAAAPAPGGTATTSPGAAAAPSAQMSATVAGTPAPQAPPTAQLPANAPPLAFEGYCPIALKTLKKWVPGDAQYGAIHRGRTYLFTGPQQREQFIANPDAYSPVFAGMDPVMLIDRQQSVEGNRAYGYEYGGAFYLFSSKETMQKFAAAPHTYAAGVRQAMSRLDNADGTVRR